MIVIVHCNADSRKCLVRLLQISGFDAAAFADGVEALAAMRRQKPRLLFINGSLSDMDGLELLRSVRADEVLADLPVGFMSGNDERQPEAERLGIAGYLLKPTATKDILDFVQQSHSRKRDSATIKPDIRTAARK